MSEQIFVDTGLGKEAIYQSLLPQIEALISGEDNLVAKLANVTAALKQALDFFWVGFYLVEGSELVLGPFQGPVACTRISKGRGVCGTAWTTRKTVIVPDVDLFPGHIACSSMSKSEIVIPLFHGEEVNMVLDVDSTQKGDFDDIDEKYLGIICGLIQPAD